MTLIDEIMEDCIMMDRSSVPDGLGGFSYSWKEGATFKASIVKDNTLNARVAEKNGVTEVYTVMVNKGIPLLYDAVFKRLKDNTTFRITSNITDSETPPRSTFQIGQVSAERWDIPND